jgi:hypothetical protein
LSFISHVSVVKSLTRTGSCKNLNRYQAWRKRAGQ